MTDSIFNESSGPTTIRQLVHNLREYYQDILKSGWSEGADKQQIRLCTMLAVSWPNNEVVEQLIKDAVKIMDQYKISPRSLLR